MHYFTYAHGFIVTANADGTIPLNSKVVCRVEEGNGAFLAVLIEQANQTAAVSNAVGEPVIAS